MTDQKSLPVNLPQTDFPMRANLPENEPKWLERWQNENLYETLRQKSRTQNRKPFVLHCGPPYANGAMHVGHTLSCTLKDLVVRSKSMAGFDTPFVPGWDCHGLPIEWKVEQDLKAKGINKSDLSLTDLRNHCRTEAAKWIEVQKANWLRFGALGDFANPYRTMDKKNEAGILREVYKLAELGYLEKGVKPVMWSTVEHTALAEAEVEYQDHESTSVYVTFKMQTPLTDSGLPEHLVVWTTTPWTLPANRAVAYGKDIVYAAVRPTTWHEKAAAPQEGIFWIAQDLVEPVTAACGMTTYVPVMTGTGAECFSRTLGTSGLKMTVSHPFYNKQVPLVEGFHVTADAGAGFVHIAPAHGLEDFQIGKENGLPLWCPVDGTGAYMDIVEKLSATDTALAGRNIWDTQKNIIAEMTAQGTLLRWQKIKHSYPCSWRSKAPLIYRTTPQWFIMMDKRGNVYYGDDSIRVQALAAIKAIGEQGGWVPAYGENRITGMIANRPDWCISRQRAWGVPIAVFYNKRTGEAIMDASIFAHVVALFEQHGIDAWSTLPTEDLLPAGWLQAHNLTAADLEKETDILDVWVDSGTSYAHVTEERHLCGDRAPAHQADLYLEGSDQHRGWFHSSLLMAVGARGSSPYKQVLTHGFVVDKDGKKMSKSIGNVVDPNDLLKKYGMDIVRLWVASSDYSEDVRISDEILQGCADAYRRFRNTFRFLLGNLYDFDITGETLAVPYADLPELEKWVLARLHAVLTQAQADYNAYHFHKVFHTLHNFCAVELSSLYFDIRKDALYCDAANTPAASTEATHRRRSCQTVLLHLLKGLATHLAPLMPFTCDEAWRHAFKPANGTLESVESIHLQLFEQPQKEWKEEGFLTEFSWVSMLRDRVNLKLDEARQSKVIGASLEAAVEVKISQHMGWLGKFPLKEFSGVSALKLTLVQMTGEEEKNCTEICAELSQTRSLEKSSKLMQQLLNEYCEIAVTKHQGEKCPRCWSYHETLVPAPTHETSLCGRCAAAV